MHMTLEMQHCHLVARSLAGTKQLYIYIWICNQEQKYVECSMTTWFHVMKVKGVWLTLTLLLTMTIQHYRRIITQYKYVQNAL